MRHRACEHGELVMASLLVGAHASLDPGDGSGMT